MRTIKFTLFIFFTFIATVVYAGNDERIGQSGGNELLINPWARSSGMHSINQASTRGIEAMRLNIAGMAFTRKTEVAFAYTDWLRGTDISISSFGLSQTVGESGVIGINISNMSFGEIDITTVGQPDEGTGGTFRPSYLNMAVAYANSFSESIHGGVLFRIINHSIADVRAVGVAFDTGIQYVTGPDDNIKFGISLRNVGTPMKFSGDGLEVPSVSETGEEGVFLQRANSYELPSLLNIGGAYDFYIGDSHRLTVAGNFTSNSFRSDFFGLGLEYAFNEMFMVRGGFRYEDGMFDAYDRVFQSESAMTGLALGATFEVPLKEDGPAIGIDYSYRTTNVFDGVHSLGVKIAL